MKNSLIILMTMLLLHGCATTIMTKGDYEDQKISIDVKKLHGKSISIIAYDKITWERYQTKSVNIRTNMSIKHAIEKFTSSQKEFSKIEIAQYDADELAFNIEDQKDYKRIEHFINEKITQFDTDYTLNIYTYSHHKIESNLFTLSPGGAYLLWGLVHIGTIGLVPMFFPVDIQLNAELYDKNKKLIASTSSNNSAAKWMWSPFIFRSDARKNYSIDLSNRIVEDTMNKTLNDIFEKID